MLKSHRPRRDREMLTLIGVFTRVESAARTLRTPRAGFARGMVDLAKDMPAGRHVPTTHREVFSR